MNFDAIRERITAEVALALVGVALIALALLGYVLVIAPKRGEAAELEDQIAATRQVLEVERPRAARPTTQNPDLRRLERALPDYVDMPRVVLDLNRLAQESGVRLDGITPQPVVALPTYQSLPIELTVRGRYFGLTQFLRRLRTQAGVTDGRVNGDGRLYAVEGISLLEGEPSFPQILAAVRISTFFGPTAAPAAPAAGTAADGTATTPGTAPTAP